MRRLRQKFLLELDPAKKREILDDLLGLVQEHWIRFVGLVAAEEDPARLQSFMDHLDQMLEARRTQSATPMQTPTSDLPPQEPGTERDG